ncbi:MAG: BACON domain-containing carbohydrate-binding protein [Bryobacteraceae bacterium]
MFCGAVFCHAQTTPLNFRPIDADYSTTLDRIIMISASPHQLHIFNPASGTDTTLGLPKAPTALSVSLNGLRAAVGHDGLITLINLGTASIEKTLVAPAGITDMVLAANYVHVLDYYQSTSIEIATGVPKTSYTFGAAGLRSRLHPNGQAIYRTTGYSPNDLVKYDVSTGPITGAASDSPYHGDYPICGKVWLSADGTRIYNECATALRSSPNPTIEMRYALSLFENFVRVAWLAESAALKRLAVIPDTTYAYPPSTEGDNRVFLMDSQYPRVLGRFLLPSFVSGGNNFAAHGRYVFFDSASSALYVLMQADGASGLTNDFAVQTYSIANPAPCSVSLGSSSVTSIGEGQYASVGITAAPGCIYQAVSNVSWVHVVSGYGSGNGSLQLFVRANTGSARSGSVTIAGQTVTVNQAAAPAVVSALRRLPFNVVDMEYHRATDRMILVSSSPDELHIYDPSSKTDQVVPLNRAPLSVSVRPDGLEAAVGHDGFISSVNLQTGAVTALIDMQTDVGDIVLAGNGYAYAFPRRDWSDIYSVVMATGVTTPSSAIYLGRVAKLKPPNHLYVTGNWTSKWLIDGVAEHSSFGNDYPRCANHWFSESADLLMNACGQVHLTDDDPALDLRYFGSFPGNFGAQWADQSDARSSIAMIPAVPGFAATGSEDTRVRMYGQKFLESAGEYELPRFPAGATDYASHGRYVFWNKAADKLFAIVKADSTANLASDHALVSVGPSACPVTLGASNVNLSSGLNFGSVTVSAAASCVWLASPSASWVKITAGAFSFGSATLAFEVAPNPSSSARTASILIGGQTFSVTQAGSCIYTIAPGSRSATAAQAVGTIAVTTAAGCTWAVGNTAPWIGITSGSSGMGNGVVSYSIAANTGTARSAEILIADKLFTVSQAGTGSATPSTSAPSPASGSGTSQTFSFAFADADGAVDLDIVNVLISDAVDGRNACYLAFVRSTSSLVLVDDAGRAGGPFAGTLTIPGAGTIGNRQCTVLGAGSSVVSTGNTLTLNLNLSFSTTFSGNKIIYVAARDAGSHNSGWLPRGVWRVPGGAALNSAMSVTPSRSTGFTATLDISYADLAGFGEFEILNVLINSAIDGRNACYLAVVRPTLSLVIVNDAGEAGGPFAGGTIMPPGPPVPGPSIIGNSQCTVTIAQSLLTDAGSSLNLRLGLTFLSPFSGSRVIYVAGRDRAGNNTGWQAMGTIDIP